MTERSHTQSHTHTPPHWQALAKAAETAVIQEYEALEVAMKEASKRGKGTKYTQPWTEI